METEPQSQNKEGLGGYSGYRFFNPFPVKEIAKFQGGEKASS